MTPSAGTPNLSSASDIARIGERFHDVPTWIQSPHREMWDKNLVTSNPHYVFTGTSMELLFPGIRFSTVTRHLKSEHRTWGPRATHHRKR